MHQVAEALSPPPSRENGFGVSARRHGERWPGLGRPALTVVACASARRVPTGDELDLEAGQELISLTKP